MPEALFEWLFRGMPRTTVPRRHVVFQQGDLVPYVFGVCRGSVEIYILNANGRKKTLTIHGPGSMFGEVFAFGDMMAFNTAEAGQESTLALCPTHEFVKRCEQNKDLLQECLRLLARKVRLMASQVALLALTPSSDRVAWVLSAARALRGDSGRTLSLTQQQLGDLAGCSRVQVARVYRSLRNHGARFAATGAANVKEL
ncbi:MAG: Crp/Fnr family transcriptional regulator [Firmicutes bacterium]|nr:Crp/Fnr family transcriptional regulator [Bacillota bacterium]